MLPETLQVDDSGEVDISQMFSYASWTSISWLRLICQHDELRQGRVSTARTFLLVELVRLVAQAACSFKKFNIMSAMLMQLAKAIGDRVEECLEQESGRRPGDVARGTHSLAFAEVEAQDMHQETQMGAVRYWAQTQEQGFINCSLPLCITFDATNVGKASIFNAAAVWANNIGAWLGV